MWNVSQAGNNEENRKTNSKVHYKKIKTLCAVLFLVCFSYSVCSRGCFCCVCESGSDACVSPPPGYYFIDSSLGECELRTGQIET